MHWAQRAASRGLHGGQEQGDQDGDDRDHHQQLDQREASTSHPMTSPGSTRDRRGRAGRHPVHDRAGRRESGEIRVHWPGWPDGEIFAESFTNNPFTIGRVRLARSRRPLPLSLIGRLGSGPRADSLAIGRAAAFDLARGEVSGWRLPCRRDRDRAHGGLVESWTPQPPVPRAREQEPDPDPLSKGLMTILRTGLCSTSRPNGSATRGLLTGLVVKKQRRDSSRSFVMNRMKTAVRAHRPASSERPSQPGRGP